jgi:protein-disulfide isomerase
MIRVSPFRFLAIPALLGGLCLAQAAPQPAQSPAPSTDAQTAANPAPTGPKFPPVDPKNFTADLPKPETVDAFLKAQIGFDTNRVWETVAVRKTIAPGFSEVEVLVGAKDSNDQPRLFRILITPDQKFAIQDSAPVPFGAHPFADARELLKKRADGPARGAASKDFLIVEFSDFECPHCKAAQPTMENLVRDYPTARIVYQNLPLTSIHPWSHKAAAYGVCVAEQNNDAFFKFADAVFTGQDQTTESNADDMLKAAAAKAGVDADKAAACAVSPAALAKVDASVALADELGVSSTPTIYINGRPISVGPNLTYELLQQIVNYQAESDGIKLPPAMKGVAK